MKKNESIVKEALRGFRGFGLSMDHCLTILFSLVLKYIELDQEDDGSVNPFTLSSLSLTYGKVIIMPEIERYVEDYMNKTNPEYRNLAYGVGEMLKGSDPRDVRTTFEIISRVESKSQIAVLLDDLIREMSACNDKSRYGQVPSESIMRIEEIFFNCDSDDKVYDPFCGMGISASNIAGTKGTIYVEEIDSYAIGITSAILFLKGTPVGNIKRGDSYRNPIEQMSYSIIVSEPPIMPKYGKDYLSNIPENNLAFPEYIDQTMLPVQHIIAKLDSKGTAVIVMPVGSLYRSGRSADVRRCIVENNLLDVVIELEPGVIKDTMVSMAVLVIKKDRESREVLLIDAKKFAKKAVPIGCYYDDDGINLITKIVNQREGREGIARIVSNTEIIEKGNSFLPSQYLATEIDIDSVNTDTKDISRKCEDIMRDIVTIDKKLNDVRGRFL